MRTTRPCLGVDCSTCRRYDLTCPEAPGLLRRCATVGCDRLIPRRDVYCMDCRDELDALRRMAEERETRRRLGWMAHVAGPCLLLGAALIACMLYAQVGLLTGWYQP